MTILPPLQITTSYANQQPKITKVVIVDYLEAKNKLNVVADFSGDYVWIFEDVNEVDFGQIELFQEENYFARSAQKIDFSLKKTAETMEIYRYLDFRPDNGHAYKLSNLMVFVYEDGNEIFKGLVDYEEVTHPNGKINISAYDEMFILAAIGDCQIAYFADNLYRFSDDSNNVDSFYPIIENGKSRVLSNETRLYCWQFLYGVDLSGTFKVGSYVKCFIHDAVSGGEIDYNNGTWQRLKVLKNYWNESETRCYIQLDTQEALPTGKSFFICADYDILETAIYYPLGSFIQSVNSFVNSACDNYSAEFIKQNFEHISKIQASVEIFIDEDSILPTTQLDDYLVKIGYTEENAPAGSFYFYILSSTGWGRRAIISKSTGMITNELMGDLNGLGYALPTTLLTSITIVTTVYTVVASFKSYVDCAKYDEKTITLRQGGVDFDTRTYPTSYIFGWVNYSSLSCFIMTVCNQDFITRFAGKPDPQYWGRRYGWLDNIQENIHDGSGNLLVTAFEALYFGELFPGITESDITKSLTDSGMVYNTDITYDEMPAGYNPYGISKTRNFRAHGAGDIFFDYIRVKDGYFSISELMQLFLYLNNLTLKTKQLQPHDLEIVNKWNDNFSVDDAVIIEANQINVTDRTKLVIDDIDLDLTTIFRGNQSQLYALQNILKENYSTLTRKVRNGLAADLNNNTLEVGDLISYLTYYYQINSLKKKSENRNMIEVVAYEIIPAGSV